MEDTDRPVVDFNEKDPTSAPSELGPRKEDELLVGLGFESPVEGADKLFELGPLNDVELPYTISVTVTCTTVVLREQTEASAAATA